MSEEIGRHKGAVETLLHEQKELSRILQIVNSQLERHINALSEAGVDADQFIKELQEESQQRQQQAMQKRQKQTQNKQNQSQKTQGSGQQGSRQSPSNNKSSSDDGKDMEDYFEDDEDEESFGNRDFSPR